MKIKNGGGPYILLFILHTPINAQLGIQENKHIWTLPLPLHSLSPSYFQG